MAKLMQLPADQLSHRGDFAYVISRSERIDLK